MFKTLFINTGSNLLVVVVKLIITFIMTPVFVHNLGNYDYGIWEIIVAVLGYMGLLDLGFKPAISRFAAKYLASKETDKLQELYSTSFVFLTIVGVILCIFFVICALFWSHLLSESGEDLFKYKFLLFILGVQLLVVFPGYVAESFLEGFQKYSIKNNIFIFNAIVGSTILYFTIEPVNAIVLLAGINTVGLSLKYLIYIYLLTRTEFGGLKPKFSTATWRSFNETIRFGGKSLVQGIASTIETGSDAIVVAYFLGPAIVLFYSIPANLISYVRNIGWTLTHAFMPTFSEMHANEKVQEIQQLYLNASRYVVALLMPTCVGIALVGGDFIGVWVGSQYQKDADTIILLLVIYMALPFINPFSTRYLTAIGEHGLLAKLYPLSACVNLIASVVLVQYWGIIGVAAGSVIPVIFLMPIVLKFCCGFLGISVGRYIVQCVWPAIIPTAVMWSSVYLFRQFQPLNSYIAIILSVITGAIVYCAFLYVFSLSQYEKQWLKLRYSKYGKNNANITEKSPLMWKKEILILLAIAVGWESYADRFSYLDSTLSVVLYIVLFAILSWSIILASYITINLIRYAYAFIFSIAFIVCNTYLQVMDAPLGYGAFVSLINAAGFMAEAVSQFFSELTYSIFGSILLFLGVAIQPVNKSVKNIGYSVAPITVNLMLSCLLFFRGGIGSQGLPPMFISLSYLNIYLFESATQPNEKRQGVKISREDRSINYDIILIVDESVRGDYLDINSSYGIKTGLDRAHEKFNIFNFGLAASVSNCSEATNLTLRYGGTRDNYRKIIDTMPSIWSYAKKSGLRTVYIDGQRTNNRLQNGMTTEELLEVDEFIQFDDSVVLERDIEIAHKLVSLINNGTPEFIYINKLGAHFPVNDKYPDNFMHYNPVLERGKFVGVVDLGHRDGFKGGDEWTRYRNSYKNTLLYNVGSFFSVLLADSLPNDAVIFYTSDHGQDLHERGNPGKSTHCQAEPNIEEGVVPIIIISGKERKHNEWSSYVSANHNHSSHYNIFPTIMELMLYDKNEVVAAYGKSFMGTTDDTFTFNIRFNARLGQNPVWKKINLNEVTGSEN